MLVIEMSLFPWWDFLLGFQSNTLIRSIYLFVGESRGISQSN